MSCYRWYRRSSEMTFCRRLLLTAALTIVGPSFGTIIELPVNYSRTAPWTELVGLGLENLTETECLRTCISGQLPRVCLFTFIMEHYAAMGTACGNCSKGVLADCFRSQCIPADLHERGVMSVNRKIPGPQINVCENDLIVVNVSNRMTGTAATLHWHGLLQNNTPSMDGVPRVTQCPIGAGEVFTYMFPAMDAGTYFHHSHTGQQKINGHYGALVIRKPRCEEPWSKDVYSFDLPEHTVVLSDWMHDYAETFFPGLPTRKPGIRPSTLLINGLGRYLEDPDDEASFDLSSVPLATFHVQTGQSYRFRFINAATMYCPIQIQIQDHDMTVIATDGHPINPAIVDAVVTYPGERFDLVINTFSAETLEKNAFWIHIRGLGNCEYEYKLDQYGVLSYGTNVSDLGIIPEGDRPTVANPLPIVTVLNHPNTTCGASPRRLCITDLEGVVWQADNEMLTAAPNVRLFIPFGFHRFDNIDDFHKEGNYQRYVNPEGNIVAASFMNNISFTFFATPTIFMRDIDPGFCTPAKLPATCQSNETSETPFCVCPYTEIVNQNDLVEITLIDSNTRAAGRNHAFHLHGYRFHVTHIVQDLNKTNGFTVEEARAILDQDSTCTMKNIPAAKDSVSVPARGFVTFRFKASNPGDWLLHCHYDWDAIVGMFFLLRVQGPIPDFPPGFPRCGNFNPLVST